MLSKIVISRTNEPRLHVIVNVSLSPEPGLGDADLVGGALDLVGLRRLARLAVVVQQPLGLGAQGSDDGVGLDALPLVLLVLAAVLLGDATIASVVLHHVAVAGEPGLGHDALLGGLEVSSVLKVEVATHATQAVVDQLRSDDFDLAAVREDLEALDGVDDVDHAILVSLDSQDNVAVLVALDHGFHGRHVELLAVDDDIDRTTDPLRAEGLELDDILAAQDLDALLGALAVKVTSDDQG